jgi:endogenous inhibitor of DNA gyrase (YacG/DUF329 family)
MTCSICGALASMTTLLSTVRIFVLLGITRTAPISIKGRVAGVWWRDGAWRPKSKLRLHGNNGDPDALDATACSTGAQGMIVRPMCQYCGENPVKRKRRAFCSKSCARKATMAAWSLEQKRAHMQRARAGRNQDDFLRFKVRVELGETWEQQMRIAWGCVRLAYKVARFKEAKRQQAIRDVA